MINSFPQVVTIAGSDSDGSAGIQADLKAFFQAHVYGMSILTTAVAGNSFGAFKSIVLPEDFIKAEFSNLANDFSIRAAKTGMLPNKNLINLVAQEYSKYNFGPLVVDPVFVTKHGINLLDEEALDVLRYKLIPLSTVITPNFKEAEQLSGFKLSKRSDFLKVANKLKEFGAKNVLIKGKHSFDSSQKQVYDYVSLEDGSTFWLENDYFDTLRINGTGDTLSALIVSYLANGNTVKSSIIKANQGVQRSLKKIIEVGHKYGPINHWEI